MSKCGITGLVLAGGKGSRLGGRDKGLVNLNGRPMISYVLERFAPQVDALVISANRNREQYADYGYPVLSDILGGFLGPMAGLHAALSAIDTPLLAMVPCDAPHLPLDLVASLAGRLIPSVATVAARSPHGAEPTFLVCRKEIVAGLERWLKSGNYKLFDWLESTDVVWVNFNDPSAFSNYNTDADLSGDIRL